MKAHRQVIRRDLWIGTAEGMLATPWMFLSIPGNFIFAALLTQFYGIDKAAYGWIVSLPAWSNALQIVLVPWLSRFLTPKELTIGLGWFNVGLWTMLVATLGFLPVGDARGVATLFMVFFVLASLSQAFLGIGWTAWVRDWVPPTVQGVYFGRRNRYISGVTLAFLLLAMLLFEIDEKSLWPFQVLMVAAVIFRYGSLIWQHGIRSSDDAHNQKGSAWGRHLLECLRAPGLLFFILYTAWVNFWLGFAGPFVPVFCFEELNFPPGSFSVLVILSTLSAIAGWAFWGRFSDRAGSIPTLVIGLAGWEVSSVFFIFISKETAWLLYPMWAWGGFFSVAYFLGSFTMLLNLLPKNARVAGSSMNLAITSVAAGVAPILAGYFLQRFSAGDTDSITVYRIGFAIKSAAVFFSFFALRWMSEPLPSGRSSAPGAFRTLRQLLATSGAGFLANFTPWKVTRRRR